MGDESGGALSRFDLRDLGVLATGPDRDFDTAVALASRAIRAPIAAFSVIDFEAGVSCLRAHFGTRLPVTEEPEIPLESSLTLAAMARRDMIVIPDTSKDALSRNHPFVRAQGIQSILAAPVLCPAEEVAALIGVYDRVPRIWTAEERETIRGIARFCTEAILLRAALRTLGLVSRREPD